MPFSATQVIHPRWAAHTEGFAEGTWNAACNVEDGHTGGGWDPVDGATPSVPNVTYTGRCRVRYDAAQPRVADAADQPIGTRVVTVALPRDSVRDLSPNARVRITTVDANGPQRLVGRVLAIEAVAYTSHAVEQLLTCRDDQANQDSP